MKGNIEKVLKKNIKNFEIRKIEQIKKIQKN